MDEKLGTNLAEVGTDCISRQAAMKLLRDDWQASESRGDAERAEIAKFHFIEISNLPAAQPEPCEDAVSREVAQRLFGKALTYKERQGKLTWTTVEVKQFIADFVEDLPSVTPKQRTGKWIRLDMHRGMADHKCTACEQECYVPTCMGEPMYAFCPNCGSYNGGEQDE